MSTKSKVLVPLLLFVMFAASLGAGLGDSGTSDERAHIAAGYSYLTTGDYRLNPEHPPLVKDIAAVPLLFGGFHFPYKYWRDRLPNEWVAGSSFLYRMGNDADRMLLLSRFPMILVALFLGFFVFKWAAELYGEKAGLFALFLYVLDANIVANSHYVTTDMGIAAAFFINAYFLWQFLRKPTKKSFLLAGLTFGIVLVTKFSAGLLIPIYGLVFLLELTRKPRETTGAEAFKLIKSFAGLALVGVIFLYLFYVPHVINMPAQTVRALIDRNLYFKSFKPVWVFHFSVFMVAFLRRLAGVPLMKPLVLYLIGFYMVSGHVARGQKIFFMGHVAKSFRAYYIVVFLIKVAIPTLIFFAVALYILGRKTIRDKDIDHIKFYLLIPVAVFFAMATLGSLDLGIRYLLPTFPFIFVFVSDLVNKVDFSAVAKSLKGKFEKQAIPAALFIALLIWYGVGSLRTYPYYLAYFNEFISGPKNGIKYVTDSSLDWGQDLKRLAVYVNDHKIKKIGVDYYGSGDVKYYLKNKGFVWQNGLELEPPAAKPPKGYYAMSATIYSIAIGAHYKSYHWLSRQKPIAAIGYSILVFRIR